MYYFESFILMKIGPQGGYGVGSDIRKGGTKREKEE
jgi:hypothetical protein